MGDMLCYCPLVHFHLFAFQLHCGFFKRIFDPLLMAALCFVSAALGFTLLRECCRMVCDVKCSLHWVAQCWILVSLGGVALRCTESCFAVLSGAVMGAYHCVYYRVLLY